MNNWFAPLMEGEVSKEEIFEKAAKGEFHEWNFQAFDFREYGYEDLMDKLKSYTANEYAGYEAKMKAAEEAGDTVEAQKWKAEMSRMVNEVYRIYRERNIYPTVYFSDLGVLDEIARCVEYKAYWDGDTVSCVSGDTEFFTGTGWKRIDQYEEGDKVLQYEKNGKDAGYASLVDPLEYIHYTSNAPFYRYTSDNFDSCLTGNHDVVYLNDFNYACKVKQDEICKKDFNFTIPLTFSYKGGYNTQFPEGSVALALLLYYRGQVESLDSSKFRVFCLNKQECMDVIKLLAYTMELSGICINCGEYSYKEVLYEYEVIFQWNAYNIYLLPEESSFTFNTEFVSLLYSLNKETRREFVESLFKYGLVRRCRDDGSIVEYFLIPRECKDGFQFILAASGYCFNINYVGSFYASLVKKDNKGYYLQNGYKKLVDDGETDKYCFSVPSHMLVLRYNGKIFITGNCGAGVGTTLCKFLFPNLQDTPSKHDLEKKGAESIFAKFNNEQYLKRAIQFCFSYKNGCPVPTSVEGGLRLVGSAPSNFRPMNAKAIYERFTPKGGTIYDFCCVSGDTEYFNGKEWKPISDYTEDEKVLQFNEDNTATLVDPEEYIHYESDEPFYEYAGVGIPSCQTGNHDVVYLDKATKTYKKIKQSDVLNGFDELIPTNCIYEGHVDLLDNQICELARFLLNRNIDRSSYFKTGYSLTIDCRIKLLKYLLPPDDWHGCKLIIHTDGDDELKDFCCSLARLSGLCAVSGKNTFMLLRCRKYREEGIDGAYHCEPAYSKYIVRSEEEARQNKVAYTHFVEVHERDKYCFVVPSHMLVLRRKGKVYITGNCGFGGRMLGALSSKNNYKYVGTDPNTETMYHLHQLGEYIEQVTGREDSYELHCCGSEDMKGKPNSIDFAFSSPPYFDLEVYSDESTQCYNKFPNLEDWLEGYVRQTIRNIVTMLKPGRCYAVNIADFMVGSGGTVAYVDEWIRLSTEEGAPLFDTVYLGVTARAGSKEQAAGELKKENILVFKKPI